MRLVAVLSSVNAPIFGVDSMYLDTGTPDLVLLKSLFWPIPDGDARTGVRKDRINAGVLAGALQR